MTASLMRTQTMADFSKFDSEIVPSSLADGGIAKILRVANEIEGSSPRFAYLCRFYAFEKAHMLNPTSSGRGVRQFKTCLLQRLEKEAEPTLEQRKTGSDATEMQSFFQTYYENSVKALENAADQEDRAQLEKAYETAATLFEVLKKINQAEASEVDATLFEVLKAVDQAEAVKLMLHCLKY